MRLCSSTTCHAARRVAAATAAAPRLLERTAPLGACGAAAASGAAVGVVRRTDDACAPQARTLASTVTAHATVGRCSVANAHRVASASKPHQNATAARRHRRSEGACSGAAAAEKKILQRGADEGLGWRGRGIPRLTCIRHFWYVTCHVTSRILVFSRLNFLEKPLPENDVFRCTGPAAGKNFACPFTSNGPLVPSRPPGVVIVVHYS